MSATKDSTLWGQIVARIKEEWRQLPSGERAWLTAEVRRLMSLQRALHEHFLDVDGALACRDCHGGCCGHGRFHPGLVNILACLILDAEPPEPDFALDCPYCGPEGCLFLPETRPYNCISFICSEIEDRLAPEDLAEFYRLEKEIRAIYERVAERYVGGSMRGLLLRGQLLDSYLSLRTAAK